ncbi:peroxide stress protein YaaA [Pseudodesulfovibrio sp. JC047]|uniref:YaaA family protein n=1 Tax=Pseudodesulfovibrio sp. JC047 TaxID=2683199 RepID=UPI0013D0B518|nr:peroxide stress protein YaaA [Pseudodesulfovibrio sp. JC047]NDV19959.1 peroxide stress protein YaaA [Pseudodesulfovibrio sp. JC047]
MKTRLLIPPSEGKADGGKNNPLKSVSGITADLLAAIEKADPQKLYGLKEKALKKAQAVNANVLNSKTLPAIERYTGVVYDAIAYHTLKNTSDFNDKVRIVSGLFGLVAPTDLIPNYRLKIDKLQAAKRWVNANSEQLKNTFVIDVLPQAHKKAVRYEHGIEVEFVLKKAGKKMPAGHQGKHIKGRFVRWLIENAITDPKQFIDFTEEGYTWTGELFLKNV